MISKKWTGIAIAAAWCIWWALGLAPSEVVPGMEAAASVISAEASIDSTDQNSRVLGSISAAIGGSKWIGSYGATQGSATPGPIQVFDVEMGKIIKTVPNDTSFQQMAMGWTKTLTGLAPQLSPGQGYSYVVRIPLAGPAPIHSGSIHFNADNLFLFIAKGKPPLLLAFDNERKPYLFLFRSSIDDFVKRIALPL
ncbi:hypothetical protein ACX93W_04840 [Paenibacillus sp. CAU 1782]